MRTDRGPRIAHWILLGALLPLCTLVPLHAQGESAGGRIAFAAFVEGNWDIYSITAQGNDLRRHTFSPATDLAPSWSPDGRCLAFQSHRDGNWEIYRLCAGEKEPSRLTDDLTFDGRPAWSPDGTHIAFDSFRAGDLDIFVMDTDGGSVVNLTEDSSWGDFGPAWSPDGKWLAFTSWRYGDPDLFLAAAEGGEARQLTNSTNQDTDPTWSPSGEDGSGGRRLAFVTHAPDESSELYLLEVNHPPAEGGEVRALTWWGGVGSPVWSPDGSQLAALWQRYDGEELLVFDALEGLPRRLTQAAMLAGPLSWTEGELDWGEPADPLAFTDPRWKGSPARGEELVVLEDVEVSNAKLNSAVVPAFKGLRQAVREKSGHDFLGTLSDMWRSPEFANETSEYASWHKAGRAIDLLWDYRGFGNAPLLGMVPQVLGGETYWRLYLRCREQDGRQGEPLTVQTWDLSYRARAVEAPEAGGHFKEAIPYGYFVDLTALAREQGWERITSHDRPDFHWHWHFLALEYWHLQQRGDHSWYAAMQEVYEPEMLQRCCKAVTLAERGAEPWHIFAKGVPCPSDGRPWWALRYSPRVCSLQQG